MSKPKYEHDVFDLAQSTVNYSEIYHGLVTPRIRALKATPCDKIGGEFWLKVAIAGYRQYCRENGAHHRQRFDSIKVLAEAASQIALHYQDEIRDTLAGEC